MSLFLNPARTRPLEQPPYTPQHYLKKKSQKRTGGVAQGIGPEFKPQYHKKQKAQIIARNFLNLAKRISDSQS
jgi:hypothetical protein